MAIPDISGLDEDDALELLWQLREKFGWTGATFTMRDINIHIEEPDSDIDIDWEDGEPDEHLTPQMRDAVRATYTWQSAIPDQMHEAAYELAPYVVLYLDGSFGVVAPGEDEKRYSANGSPQE